MAEAKKVLITGHLGFIGRHLHRLIPEADGIDIKDGKDIRTCNLDVDYTHVFHLAAIRSALIGEEDSENAISTNCWGTVRLLKRYKNARFLNITSASAETVSGIYGATKKFAETAGGLFNNVLNVRPYNIFGEEQELESNTVIPNFISAMINRERPIMYGDGNYTRDFTYVLDLVLHLKHLMFETNLTGLYHCGYSKPITIKELCVMIFKYVPEIDFRPRRKHDYLYSVSPKPMPFVYGREEGLKRTVEWYREHW